MNVYCLEFGTEHAPAWVVAGSFEHAMNVWRDTPAPDRGYKPVEPTRITRVPVASAFAAFKSLPSLLDEVERLRADCEQWREDHNLQTHKVITCGVAADHPDSKLTLRADYMKWDSPQAEKVRALRQRADEAQAEVERLRAEKANLRRALIASGKAVGCVLSDAVSDEFLMGVPQEVLVRVAKLRAELERRERMDGEP